MNDTVPAAGAAGGLAAGVWRLDPARSSVEFHVRHFYGLITVKGHFDRYQGTLNLSSRPAFELLIEATASTPRTSGATSTCARPTSSTPPTMRRSGLRPIRRRSAPIR